MKNLITTLFFGILLLGMLPRFVFASEIRLESQKSKVHIGEQFFINLVVQSDTPLNAIEGKIVFDNYQVKVEDIILGGSVINFWVDKPYVRDNNIIFSGASPVGFSGNSEKIFSVLFTALKDGDAQFNLSETISYLNDGNGTKATLDEIPAVVSIDNSLVEREERIIDTEPPEDFTPIVVKDENINGGEYTLIFLTEDKSSGISKYEIKEGIISFYKTGTSPYLLKSQALDKDIYIRVTDKMKNERVVVLPAKYPPKIPGSDLIIYALILVISSLSIMLWKKFLK